VSSERVPERVVSIGLDFTLSRYYSFYSKRHCRKADIASFDFTELLFLCRPDLEILSWATTVLALSKCRIGFKDQSAVSAGLYFLKMNQTTNVWES
jgi:hypothetical protein